MMVFAGRFRRALTSSLMTLAALSFLLSGCGIFSPSDPSPADPPSMTGKSHERVPMEPKDPDANEPAGQGEPPASPPSYTTSATLVAVGDIMMHSPQIPAAYDPETGTYSFDHYFEKVKPLLAGDWVIANLETPLAGEDAGGYSGYPLFNAPEQLAEALKHAGFGIVSTANNHTLDRNELGVLRTLDHVKAQGLVPVGTHASPEEAGEIPIIEKNGIRMAFLAYTYGTNGIPIPAGKDYLVNLIDEEKIKADIARARSAGADLVTVSMHFGYEYHLQPNEEQKRLSRSLIAAGADIILGSHPHVLQPYERIAAVNDEGLPREGIVIYSLGNFISNQGPEQGTAKYTDVGLIFKVKAFKSFPEEKAEIGEVELIPTWVHKYRENGKRRYEILPIEAELANRDHPLLTDRQYRMLEQYYAEMSAHLHSMAVPVAGEQSPDSASNSATGSPNTESSLDSGS